VTSPRSDSRRLGSAARGEQDRCRPVERDLGHDLGLFHGLEPAGADVGRAVDQHVDPTEPARAEATTVSGAPGSVRSAVTTWAWPPCCRTRSASSSRGG